jgi:O-antigen ligase
VASYFFFKKKLIQTPFVTSRVFLVLFSFVLVSVQVFHVFHAAFPTWEDLFGPIAGLLGKQTDLTGRFDIWVLILPEIAKHWLFGFGYGAFWLGVDSPSQFIIDQLGWIPYQSHNGYLDVLNELGVAGFCLLLGMLGAHINCLYRLSRFDASQAAFHGALFLMIIISNFSESSLFRGIVFFTTMLIYSSIAVTSALAQHRRSSSAEMAFS